MTALNEFNKLKLRCKDTSLPKSNKDMVDCNRLEISKYPLIDYCLKSSGHLSLISPLLSHIHSPNISAIAFASDIANTINKSSINVDILKVFASSTLNQYVHIAFIDDMKKHIPTLERGTMSGIATYEPSSAETYIVVLDNKKKYQCLMHELTHHTMRVLFRQKYTDPYDYKNEAQKQLFINAIKDTLVNIQQHLKLQYDYSLPFSDNESTHAISEKIVYMIEAFGDPTFLDFHRKALNLDSQLVKFGLNKLEAAMLVGDELLIKELLLEGEDIKESMLLEVIAGNSMVEFLHWLQENNISFNVNQKNYEGYVPLDYAFDPKMIQALISAGAVAYPSNYKDICSSTAGREIYDKIKIIDKVRNDIPVDLKAIRELLTPANYDEENEYSEFIAFFVQTIASEEYTNTNIRELTQPLFEYWNDIIKPMATEYQELYSVNDSYFQLFNEYSLDKDLIYFLSEV